MALRMQKTKCFCKIWTTEVARMVLHITGGLPIMAGEQARSMENEAQVRRSWRAALYSVLWVMTLYIVI